MNYAIQSYGGISVETYAVYIDKHTYNAFVKDNTQQ